MRSEIKSEVPYKVINIRKPTEATAPASYTVMLNWYEKAGNNLVGEEAILDLSVDDVLNLFGVPFWNQVYHCFAIEDEQVSSVQSHVKHTLDPKNYAYFIELYKVS